MIKERTVFVTEDGKTFDVIKDAQVHEQKLNLAEEMRDATGLYFDSSGSTPFEVADWLVTHYNITPKEKP